MGQPTKYQGLIEWLTYMVLDGIIRQTDLLRRQNTGFRNISECRIHTVIRQILGRRHKAFVLRHLVQFL